MKFVKLNMYRNPCIYPLSGLHIEFCGCCADGEGKEEAYGKIIFHQNAQEKSLHSVMPLPIYDKMVEEIERFLVNEQTIYDVSQRMQAIDYKQRGLV